MLIVKNAERRINFVDPETNVETPDSYFIIRNELPYDGYMEYLDAAVSYELQLPGEDSKEDDEKMKATTNKLTISRIQNILMEHGLVEIVGVQNEDGTPITAANWKKLSTALMGQVLKAIQTTADVKRPNSQAPSSKSSKRARRSR